MFMYKIFSQFPECDVTIVAPYGSDFAPYSAGISLLPPEPLNGRTLVYENISHNGKRVQKAHFRENASGLPLSAEILKKTHEADLIFYTPLLPTFSVEYLAILDHHAKKSAFKVLLPQGFFRDFSRDDTVIEREFNEVRDILEHVNLVIVSDQDHTHMKEELEKWVTMHPVTCIMTKGSQGALILQGAKQLEIPTKEVKESDIVDSVGSGDIFSAAFAYQFVLSHDLEKAGRFANEIARQCLFYTADQIKIDLPS